MENIKIIYNPSSGMQLEQEKAFAIARKLMENQDCRVTFYATHKKQDAYQEALRTYQEDFTLLLVCGGDGTVNEVVNGIMKSPKRIPLAILAAGSVNDFSEHLQLPKEVDEFYDMLLRGKKLACDVGKVNDTYFINVVAGGAFTNIAHEVPVDTKTLLGRFAYYLQGAIELPVQLNKSYPLRIQEADGSHFTVDAFLFLVANSPTVGGFRKMVPDASVSDGLLDLLIIKKTSPKDMVEIFSKIIGGTHPGHPAILYKKVPSLELLDPDGKIELDIDGEKGGSTPASFQVFPSSLEIIIP